MAGVNRHLREDTESILAPVHGNIEGEVGDLLLLNNVAGSVGFTSSTLLAADNYVFPFTYARGVTAASYQDNVLLQQFIGVAMTGSLLGVTNNIVVATEGVFRYPLNSLNSAVTEGAKVSACCPAITTLLIGTGSSNQAVINHATQSGKGTTAYIGYCVKTESGASFVDFRIHTAFSGATIT